MLTGNLSLHLSSPSRKSSFEVIDMLETLFDHDFCSFSTTPAGIFGEAVSDAAATYAMSSYVRYGATTVSALPLANSDQVRETGPSIFFSPRSPLPLAVHTPDDLARSPQPVTIAARAASLRALLK